MCDENLPFYRNVHIYIGSGDPVRVLCLSHNDLGPFSPPFAWKSFDTCGKAVTKSNGYTSELTS